MANTAAGDAKLQRLDTFSFLYLDAFYRCLHVSTPRLDTMGYTSTETQYEREVGDDQR